jgi:hypothetical protein
VGTGLVQVALPALSVTAVQVAAAVLELCGDPAFEK